MKTFLLLSFSLFFVIGCAGVKIEQGQQFTPLHQPQQVFVLPFTTVMVPNEVSENLFDRFVDNLNQQQAATGLEFVILKRTPQEIGEKWLSEHDYVAGEIFAYVEDKGSSTVSMRARSRLSYFSVGQTDPALKLNYPVEIFYEKDYQTIEAARLQLAEKVADHLAKKLLETLTRP